MADCDEQAGTEGEAAFPERRSPDRSRQFSISRLLAAPKELVFRMWTEEEHLKNWFGPKGFTIPVCRLNLAPGGAFHYCMRAANGVEMWGKWIFREIEPPERLVLVNTFSNKHGNLTRHPYVPDWPLEMLTVTTFFDREGGTELKIAWLPIHATEAEMKTFDSMHEAMTQGWNGTLDQLAEYLEVISSMPFRLR